MNRLHAESWTGLGGIRIYAVGRKWGCDNERPAPDALIGEAPSTTSKRGPAPKLQQQIERIGQLPKTKQRFVMEMLDTVLAQAGQ